MTTAPDGLRGRLGPVSAPSFTSNSTLSCPRVPLQLYMYQLFRSLAYIHSFGICHRDIKPQNLLLDPETAVLKLCDFGRYDADPGSVKRPLAQWDDADFADAL